VRIVAIETAETAGSLAAASDTNLLAELKLSPSTGSAQSLAPGVKQLLDQVGWRPQDVELVAVAVGPGSFTGLRVGVTTAKALAYCVQAGVLGVDTLEVIATAVPQDVRLLSLGLDAHRGEVVTQLFQRGRDGFLVPVGPSQLVQSSVWLAQLPPGVCVAGPVLRKLAGRVPGHVVVLDQQCWLPSASAVAALAVRRYRAGQRDDIWRLVPRYCRRSAAEENWEAANRPG